MYNQYMRNFKKILKSRLTYFLTALVLLYLAPRLGLQDHSGDLYWNSDLSDIDIAVLKNGLNDADWQMAKNKKQIKFNNYYYKTSGASFKVERPLPGEVIYFDLDSLGRPTGVIANINHAILEKERQEDKEKIRVNPIGWRRCKRVNIPSISGRDEEDYYGCFYNRSHLLADSLGGLPILENLMTGTRMQNAGEQNEGGMIFVESIAHKFFRKKTDQSLLYQVIPLYYGDEIIARYVVVDILSSDGAIDEHILIPNSAYGFEINYSTSRWKKIH